jgi:hypothetical protein
VVLIMMVVLFPFKFVARVPSTTLILLSKECFGLIQPTRIQHPKVIILDPQKYASCLLRSDLEMVASTGYVSP